MKHKKKMLAVGVYALALTAGAVFAADLTVVGWGGALSGAQNEAIDTPYAEKAGITLTPEVYNGGLAQVKAQIESGNVTWDVMDAEMADAELGCSEGLLEEISMSDLAKGVNGENPQDDFFADALHDCGVASYVWANVFAYDQNAFPNGGPDSIDDLFNIADFPGKRALRKSPRANLEWALMADGVAADKIYEVLATEAGVDRAFAMLDKVKDNTIWWEAGAQPPQLLADGEVAITSAYNGRLFNAIVKEGQPFTIVWDGQVWDYGAYIIPKNAPNKERALDFIRFATSPKQLAALTDHISYGPARASGVALVSDSMKVHLPTAPANFAGSLRQSSEFWTDYGDQLNVRFNTWLSVN